MAKPARKVKEQATEEAEYKLRVGGHRQDGIDYETGDKFWSSSDLVARDTTKFECTGNKRPVPKDHGPAKSHQFPGGQVSDGMQRTTGVTDHPDGDTQVSGFDRDATDEAVVRADRDAKDAAGKTGSATPAHNFPPPAKKSAQAATTVPKLTDDDLHAMTVADLREFAETHEIELKGAVKKDDVIKAIKGRQ